MAEVTPSRNVIQVNDVKFRSSISEAVGNKLSASINHIFYYQTDRHVFNLNGPYSLGAGSIGTDGVFIFPFDAEIVAFDYYNGDTGTSNYTEVDVHWLSGGDTDEGTIFSTKPKVETTAADGTYTLYRVSDSTTVSNPTGHTLAVLSKTTFAAGDAIRLDLDFAMLGANNFQLAFHFRPI